MRQTIALKCHNKAPSMRSNGFYTDAVKHYGCDRKHDSKQLLLPMLTEGST